MNPRRGRAAFAGLVALVALATYGAQPPAPVSSDAGGFSAESAMEHVRVVAARPHESTTEANAEVRAYLVEELERAGLEVELQRSGSGRSGVDTGTSWGASPGPTSRSTCARAFPAPVAKAPCCCSVTTTRDSAVRAPRTTRRPSRRCSRSRDCSSGPCGPTCCWSSPTGRSGGLDGAYAFAEGHPWMESVRLVLNFEARGNGGTPVLFETSGGNGRLVREFAAVAPHPVASSLGPTIYDRMPNDTDFSVFKERGVPGLNFAFIGGGSAYHQPFDTPENLDRRSLQQQGANALALAQHFAALDLDDAGLRAPDATFFNVSLGARRAARDLPGHLGRAP